MISANRFNLILILCLTAVLTACGGSTSGNNDSSESDSDNGVGGTTDPAVAAVTLISETPNLSSASRNASQGIQITAIARDENNTVVEGQQIEFSASGGVLQVDNATTEANGTASATLYAGENPSNRTIEVTAAIGSQRDSIDIAVTGTSITLQGPQSIGLGGAAEFSATLTDSAGNAISNQSVDIASENGNSLGASMLQTNAQGVVNFTVNANQSGADTIDASALGASASAVLNVGNADFGFSSPEAGTAVAITQSQDVSVRWQDDAGPVNGEDIRFTTSRGTLTEAVVATDSQGMATTTVNADNAGIATITATAGNDLQATLQIRFVAMAADSVVLQANPTTVNVNQSSTVTATARDTDGNLVSDALVEFNLTDTSGGLIEPSQKRTDNSGRASTTFTAGPTAGTQPAIITARIAESDDISENVSITVGGSALRITLGTGDEVTVPNTTTYRLPYVAFVTDAAGNPTADAEFQLSVQSIAYQEGVKVVPAGGDFYTPEYVAPDGTASFQFGAGCPNEDADADGVLDTEDLNGDGTLQPSEDENDNDVLDTEDVNGNGQLEPGNTASVPRTVALDEAGSAQFDVSYPKSFSGWVKVRLRATASVSGSESTESVFFVLPASAEESSVDSGAPPGATSPFGTDGNCATTFDPDTGNED